MKADYYSPYKAAHHPQIVEAIRSNKLVAPTNIQVDLEAFCPHSCEFCSYRNVNWQSFGMVFDEPAKIVPEHTGLHKGIALDLPRQMAEAGIPSIEITGGGESLVYPHILPFLDALAEYDLKLAIVTNGVAFRKSLREHVRNLQWIRFSVDAITPEVYEQVHRTPAFVHRTVLKHIKDYLGERDHNTTVGISFVITPHNFHQVQDAAGFFKDLGVDSIRYTFTYEPGGDGRLGPEERDQVIRALEAAKGQEDRRFKVFGVNRLLEYSAPNTDFSFCGYQHFVWAIGYNGKVYPCCIMKYHPPFEMGDLYNQTLKQIVTSPERERFAFHLDVESCKSCWLRDKNKFIESLLTPPAHPDFV